MRFHLLPFALALLATAASAQPADRLGVYVVAGSAAPERALFPDAADPFLTVGLRLSPLADVQVGARFGTHDRLLIGALHPRRVAEPGEVVDYRTVETTRALTTSVGLHGAAGPAVLRVRASLGLDAYDRTVTAQIAPERADASPQEVLSDHGSATFAHAGVSTVAAVPVRLGAGQVAPGLGLAAASSRTLRGSLDAQPARLMPFLSLPTTARLHGADVTLDATLGLAKGAGSRGEETNWAPVVEAGLRVEI